MKLETALNATEIINKCIKHYMAEYAENLPAILEMRAESTLKNGNFHCDASGNLENDVHEFLIADLLTLRRAINKHKNSVKLYCTYYGIENIYNLISLIMSNVGITTTINRGELILTPAEKTKPQTISSSQPISMYEQEDLAMAVAVN